MNQKKINKNVRRYFLCFLVEKGLATFLCSLYILQMTTKKCANVANNFVCEMCDYYTSRKSSYTKHLLTAKHLNTTNDYNNTTKNIKKVAKTYDCVCGAGYFHHSSLWKHKKSCQKLQKKSEEPEEKKDDMCVILLNQNMELIKQNKDFKELIVEQNKQIIDLVGKSGFNNNTNCNNNNTNNNQFNLQFFLNEQCKDALNIMDFIEQLQLKTADLDMVGRVGYTEGISKLFIRGLKELDVFKRPIHCSDLKREVMYVKDKDAWEKDNENKNKMKKAIKFIAAKNFKQLDEWKEDNPSSEDTESKKHMEYHNIIINSLGGSNQDDDDNNYNKIIKTVAKEAIINKNCSK